MITSDNQQVRRKTESFRAQLHGAQLQQLFDYLPGVYFVVKNREGEVMMANQWAVRLCGFDSEDDMLGKTDHDLFPKEQADAYVADDRMVLETGTPVSDRVEMAPDPENAISWYVTNKVPLHDKGGAVIGVACISRNMTYAYETLRPYAELSDVLAYVQKKYADPIMVDDLARIAHLSTRQFERRFRKVFHLSPVQHILQVRIQAACQLLSSSHDTVAAIAVSVGFYDHSHFSRSFKKVMGVSPRAYRAQR